VPSDTRDAIRRRAEHRCEYCLLRQEHAELSHHIEHIVAKQHGGPDDLENLALACHRCNLNKGPNLTGIDPLTGSVASLFHPRRDHWPGHFRMSAGRIEGLTPTGRPTVRLLRFNDARRVQLRREVE
jgi:hypothetical protein